MQDEGSPYLSPSFRGSWDNKEKQPFRIPSLVCAGTMPPVKELATRAGLPLLRSRFDKAPIVFFLTGCFR
jgi:hypothetical protein